MNTENVSPTALITGASRRVGANIARFLHALNFNIVIHYNTSKEDAQALSLELNNIKKNTALCVAGDLLDETSYSKIINDALGISGKLNLLINNASIFLKSEQNDKTFSQQAEEDLFHKMFKINVFAPLSLSHLAFSHLNETKGAIINISDVHAAHPLKGYSIYCQSKAALNMQTKTLAQSFAPNVRVNAISPGAIMWPENSNKLTSKDKRKIIDKTLLKKHGNPVDIAKAVYMLYENSYITGQIINVDGGRYL